MIGMVLLASPLVGAAAAGVVLRWQEIQDSRSATTTTTTTTTAPTSTSGPQRQTEPLEESVVAPQVEVIAPPTTATVTHREAEIAALEAEIAARLVDASRDVRLALDVEALQAAASGGDRNRAMQMLAEAEAAEALTRLRSAFSEAQWALNAADRDVLTMGGSALQDALDAEDWPRVVALLAEAETRTAALRVHPNVHDEGVAMLEAIVARHEPEWSWVRAAWDATDVRFYDPSLPGVSAPAAAVSATPDARAQMWFTLDVLRPSDGPFSEPRQLENTLLHELGHVWNNGLGGGDWPLVQAQFYEHYAGCRGSGLSSEALREELLADATVMITRDIAHRGPGWHNGNFVAWAGYYDPEGNRYGDAFGYYDANGFSGCLIDGAGPPQHLTDAIRETLLHDSQTDASSAS